MNAPTSGFRCACSVGGTLGGLFGPAPTFKFGFGVTIVTFVEEVRGY